MPGTTGGCVIVSEKGALGNPFMARRKGPGGETLTGAERGDAVKSVCEAHKMLLDRLEAIGGGGGGTGEGEAVAIATARRDEPGGDWFRVDEKYKTRSSEMLRWGMLGKLRLRVQSGERITLACHCAPGVCHADELAVWLMRGPEGEEGIGGNGEG